MTSKKQYTTALLIAAMSTVTTAAIAEEPKPLKIVSQPGKRLCQALTKQIMDTDTKVELCVQGGSFAHDVYSLFINRQLIAKGIDDETTNGVSGVYRNEKAILICTPQNEAPKSVPPESIAAFQKMMGLSAEDAKKAAIAANSIEVGRLCKALLADIPLIEVQVLFQ